MATASPSMTDIHDQLVAIMRDYLGPAGERFLDRQIRFHLQKDPKTVNHEDVGQLKEWVKVSLALLTEDKRLVDDCIARLEAL